jgi:anthraniloyl-CoA monooxygenase
MYSARDGLVDDFHLVHLGSRALGGAGLLLTEMTGVAPDGRITPGCAGLWRESHRDAWKRIVDFVHARSPARIGVQLGHAGRKGSTELPWVTRNETTPLEEGGWPVIGPSAEPYQEGMQVPREMTRDDMDRVIAQFAHSTRLAEQAGFDLVELHLAHGYLLSSFLSPLSNLRTDAYGGDVARRLRFPLEVVEAVRATWPGERPMSVRISATDWVPGGWEVEDSVVLARALRERGVDIVHVSTGQVSPRQRPVFGRMWQARFSDQVRNESELPTISVGNISTADQVNSILAAGRADLVALARPHLLDAAWTQRAAIEQDEQDALFWPKPYLSAKPRPGRREK